MTPPPARRCSSSPSDQRNTVRSLIKDLKEQGAKVVKLIEQQEKAERQARRQGGQGETDASTNFGPLPGGAGQQAGQTP